MPNPEGAAKDPNADAGGAGNAGGACELPKVNTDAGPRTSCCPSGGGAAPTPDIDAPWRACPRVPSPEASCRLGRYLTLPGEVVPTEKPRRAGAGVMPVGGATLGAALGGCVAVCWPGKACVAVGAPSPAPLGPLARAANGSTSSQIPVIASCTPDDALCFLRPGSVCALPTEKEGGAGAGGGTNVWTPGSGPAPSRAAGFLGCALPLDVPAGTPAENTGGAARAGKGGAPASGAPSCRPAFTLTLALPPLPVEKDGTFPTCMLAAKRSDRGSAPCERLRPLKAEFILPAFLVCGSPIDPEVTNRPTDVRLRPFPARARQQEPSRSSHETAHKARA